jgi:hypothetical protein
MNGKPGTTITTLLYDEIGFQPQGRCFHLATEPSKVTQHGQIPPCCGGPRSASNLPPLSQHSTASSHIAGLSYSKLPPVRFTSQPPAMQAYTNCLSHECVDQVCASAEMADRFSSMSTPTQCGSEHFTASVTNSYNVKSSTRPRVVQGKSAMGAPLVTPSMWRNGWTTPGAILGLYLLGG